MTKDEIVKQIEGLTRAVKTKGRAYTASQREEMRKEISYLSIELKNIEFQEDLIFIEEFEKKNTTYFINEKDDIKSQIDVIVAETKDENLKFVFEYKFKSFYNEIGYVEHTQKEIESLKEALSFLSRNEKIPSSNSNWLKDKNDILRMLASSFKSLSTKFNKLSCIADEIKKMKSFFDNDSKLQGFVFITNPIFSDASDFDKGFAIVDLNSKKMYFSFAGSFYKIDTIESEIPKIEKQRLNTDLVPFELNEDAFSRVFGYKNFNNEIIIPAKFNHASPFMNGFAKVGVLKKDHIYYGLIDTNGRFVLPCEFVEIGNVHNDIVLYKKHIYKEGYSRTNSFNFNMRHEVKYLGLFSGYLIYDEIKPAIQREFLSIKTIEASMASLKTNGEVDNAHDKIREHRGNVDFYLKYILTAN